MKKGVALLVSAVALLAVLFVAFLGTNPVGIIPVIPIESVKILDMEGHSIEFNDDTGKRILAVNFSSLATDPDGNEYMFYIFDTEILPSNATNRKFLYYCSENPYVSFVGETNTEVATSGENGVSKTTANHTGKVVVTKPAGDTNTTYEVDIYCKPDDGHTGQSDAEQYLGTPVSLDIRF
jgi:hypothetical protein